MKGTETQIRQQEEEHPESHRGVPLVKGTETLKARLEGSGFGRPQRRPPREGD